MTNANQQDFSRTLIEVLRELNLNQLNLILLRSGHNPFLQFAAQANLGLKQHQGEDGWVFRYQVTNKLSGKILGDVRVLLGNNGTLTALPLP